LRNEAVKRKVLPLMLEQTRELGEAKSRSLIRDALEAMHAVMDDEVARIKDLAEVNDHVRPEEIAAMEARQKELASAINGARVRIDAVRLIWKAPAA
jgi:ATP-dependent helicase HepA